VADGPIHVLVVEDSPDYAALIRDVLNTPWDVEPDGSAFEVTHVVRLADARHVLGLGGIDVVLLDLFLPDGRGLESLAAVRAQASSVPVVVLTALDDERLGAQAVHHGAQDYLVKGEAPNELIVRSIRYAIGRKEAETEMIRAQVAQAEAEAALRNARLAERQRRMRQQRELRSLDRLSAPKPAQATAQAFGVESLSQALPDTFHDLIQRYAQVLELALEQRAYKVDHPLADSLRDLADVLGFLHAGPRDVIELHTAALKHVIAGVTSARAQAYIDEARVRVLELMGYLVAYYRR
jgi:DNA-binding response OmpR family regulator